VRADKLYLVGFMGAGKTTMARALAARLGWQAVDIDEAIEARERLTVAEVFARHGEPYFRSVEQAVLLEQIAARHLVIATGGGTYADPQNRALMNSDGAAIWLDVPLDRLIARIPSDGRRPLAADRSGSNACIINGARRTSRPMSGSMQAGRASARSLNSLSSGWRVAKCADQGVG
jgi:shikimate kinase